MRVTEIARLSLLRLAVLAGLLAASAPAVAAPPAAGVLTSRPSAAARDTLPVGLSRLSAGALVYRPPGHDGPRPLIVLLHGAGGGASDLIDLFRSHADREGFILLAPKSRDYSWDLIIRAGKSSGRGRATPQFGADVAAIDSVLGELFSRAPVDRRKVVAAGFSDGASYALSLGLANPTLFTGIVALSPGFLRPPDRIVTGQRIFISHGRKDRILPFQSAERIADVLGQLNLEVRFRPFDGPHTISRSALDEGVAFVAGK